MKGINKLKILEFLNETSSAISDLLFIFTVPYGTSRCGIDYLLRKKHIQDACDAVTWEDRRRFTYLLYNLRKDKLVEGDDKKVLRLTQRGREILEKLRVQKSKSLPDNGRYKTESDDELKIIIFDIPEEERQKRDWLRSVLKNLKFSMLQKSVWVGKGKLPKEFINDLLKYKIISYVDIFTISKRGSLRKLE